MVTDLATAEEVPIFNPRLQRWAEHFKWDGELIVPLTRTAAVTVTALAMNRPLAVAIRQEESARGRHPPT